MLKHYLFGTERCFLHPKLSQEDEGEGINNNNLSKYTNKGGKGKQITELIKLIKCLNCTLSRIQPVHVKPALEIGVLIMV